MFAPPSTTATSTTTITSSTSTSVAIAPLPPAEQQWGTPLPPSPPLPINLILRTSLQDYYLNPFGIVNRHATLSTLIDAAYPRNRCFTCDSTFTSRSETDQHLQTYHHTKGYLCLYPHCDQVFRSRGVLRFHIASCHIVVNEKVSKTDPLYLWYAPSDPMATFSSSIDADNTVAPKKRKYERRRKAWNPMNKTSLPGQTNFALTPDGVNMQPDPALSPATAVPAKRRGRPPKNRVVMDAIKAKIIPPHTAPATITNSESASLPPLSAPPVPTPTPVSAPPVTAPPPPTPLVASPPPPKVFRMVQQVIPNHTVSSSSPSSTLKGRANLSLQSKTLLAEKYNPLRCPSCHLGFKRKTNVVKHLTAMHYGEECFQCVYPNCDHPKRFSTREGLVYHILRMHDNVDNSGDS